MLLWMHRSSERDVEHFTHPFFSKFCESRMAKCYHHVYKVVKLFLKSLFIPIPNNTKTIGAVCIFRSGSGMI